MFDDWLPRMQRLATLVLGTAGVVYGTITGKLEYWGMAGPLLMFQGYQELRRAGIEEARETEPVPMVRSEKE